MNNQTIIEIEGQQILWGSFAAFHLNGNTDDGAMGGEWLDEVARALKERGEWLAGVHGCDIRLAK